MEQTKLIKTINVRITGEQKQEIKDLAKLNGLTYSDMFRKLLNLGILAYKGVNKSI